MKRFRHYNKDKAILLSCFGSIIEQDKYLELKKYIESEFKNIDVYLSFSSKMVIKKLKKKKIIFKNLPQSLANLDLEGYRKIIVSSINLFPTDEHNLVKRTVKGFREFSLSNIKTTKAVFSKNKSTTLAIKAIDDKLRVQNPNTVNLYIMHGTPDFETNGIASIDYVSQLLKVLNPKNYFCSLEGSFPFYAIKEALIRDIKNQNSDNNKNIEIQIVPILLVSGNHYNKDVIEIKEELSENFNIKIVDSFKNSDKFSFIEIDEIKDIIKDNIKEEIDKMG